MIDTYTKAKAYLDSFINYERKLNYSYKKSCKLKRMHWLLEVLDIPYQKLKVIHIAGTKGKGSTANFCANILASQGFRVGLYTSPHFFDFRERIMIKSARDQDRMISKNDVINITEEFRSRLEKIKIPESLGRVSFFEIYTAIAFKYFLDEGLDFVVLETGLGGRLDATNVVKPRVSIITHIGYDHTDKLGKRLADIAREKAGIIKKKIPLVCSPQRPSALREIKNKCRIQDSSLYVFGRDFFPQNIRLKKDCTLFDFKSPQHYLKDVRIDLKGRCQVENICCALKAVLLLKDKGLIREVPQFKGKIQGHYLPGRFEIVSRQPLVVMDIAHNPSSFAVLCDNLRFYFPDKKVILIFGCSKDKDVRAMLKKISYHKIILTKSSNPRAYSPEEIKKICNLKEAFLTKDIKEAIALAHKIYTKDSAITISGSLFLVAEAKKILQPKDQYACL